MGQHEKMAAGFKALLVLGVLALLAVALYSVQQEEQGTDLRARSSHDLGNEDVRAEATHASSPSPKPQHAVDYQNGEAPHAPAPEGGNPGALVVNVESCPLEPTAFEHAREGRAVSFEPDTRCLESGKLSFVLFGGKVVTATETRREYRKGGMLWAGKISSEGDSGEVVLTEHNGLLAGTVQVNDSGYEVTPMGDGKHYFYEVDEMKAPLCGSAELPHPPQGASAVSQADPGHGTQVSARADSGVTVVDVLVVYTPASRVKWGSAGIVTRIQNCVDKTNQAFVNSLVNVQMTLVGTAETNYQETGNMSDALHSLRTTTDGYMDEVHALRDSLAADLVSLACEDSNYAGIAYVMTSLSTSFSSAAFSAVNSTWALSAGSFQHELGHNMGCRHDKENSSAPGVFPYSYGYRTPDNALRTVMAYAPGTRINYFSGPNLSYNGYSLGITDQADNARSLNNAAATVSAFRTTGVNAPPLIDSGPWADPNPINLAASTTANVVASDPDNGPAPLTYSWTKVLGPGVVSFSPNGTNAANTSTATFSAGGSYVLRVTVSDGSDSVAAETGVDVIDPSTVAAPTNLTATVSGSTINLSWTDNSTNETGFQIDRGVKVRKTTTWTTNVATVGANATIFSQTVSNGTYLYRVRAVNSSTGKVSANSNEVQVKVGTTGGGGKGKNP